MPYYKNKKILFIHIPKTGGTVIEHEIKKKDKQTLYSGFRNNILQAPYNKISLQHQYYSTLYKYRNKLNINFNDIKIFGVVRNPYDRVISDLFWYNLIKKNYNSTQVYYVIKDNYLKRTDLDNHNVPQYKFVESEDGQLEKNIKLFKTEELNHINDKINTILDININIKRTGVNKDYSRYLNDKSIYLINKYYKKDFELFKYKKKRPFKSSNKKKE